MTHLENFIETIIEASEERSWKIASAMHSRLVPHLMRTRSIDLKGATILAETPMKIVMSAMTDDNLSVGQIREVLVKNLTPYFQGEA